MNIKEKMVVTTYNVSLTESNSGLVFHYTITTDSRSEAAKLARECHQDHFGRQGWLSADVEVCD